MKAEFTADNKPKYDYRGAHVTFWAINRTLLGEIKAIKQSKHNNTWLAAVKFFNGEWWPIEPPLSALEILERS